MNKENNKSAAGLRRSAVAERIRLREEWLALKGPELQRPKPLQKTGILTKKHINIKTASNAAKIVANTHKHKESSCGKQMANEALRGVVALVEVGSEVRALPLRAALAALGASVLPTWSPLVTHLVWSEGGSRATRARARALACRLVSPLWVEACAAAASRLPERAFPAAARASDLPSPRTLRALLKKAEMENITIADLLTDSNEEKAPRLRISSDTDQNTTDSSMDTSKDTSRDTSKDTSLDTTKDTSVCSRVNTAPRRALPKTSSLSPTRPVKSKRKLFNQKEADMTKENGDSDSTLPPKLRKPSLPQKTKAIAVEPKLTQRDRRELARAERLAKKLIANCTPKITQGCKKGGLRPWIVLTGMSRDERRVVTAACKEMRARMQRVVDHRTTHVLLGTCAHSDGHERTELTGSASQPAKPRTLSALQGAARGCRVLHATWVTDAAESGVWPHHAEYEVVHLRKIAQRARMERAALGKLRSEYAYDVFNGMRVRMSQAAAQRDAALALLRLCGAHAVDCSENDGIQNGGPAQNGGNTQHGTQNGGLKSQSTKNNVKNYEFDVKIGSDHGEISSKWVFDSVAAGRMRTTRRYVINCLSESELVAQMEKFQC